MFNLEIIIVLYVLVKDHYCFICFRIKDHYCFISFSLKIIIVLYVLV